MEAVKNGQAHLVMMSVLLTTTMLSMKKTIEQLKAAGLCQQVKVASSGL